MAATWTISRLARIFGLSRSTLLFYDRTGLLRPSNRSSAGYRLYSEKDRQKLERICHYRQTGLPLEQIRAILASGRQPAVKVLEKRLADIRLQCQDLHSQQRLLSEMLKQVTSTGGPTVVNKDLWVSMLKAAGMDESGMKRWHGEFERRAPQAHHEFLVSLGIPEVEVRQIRQWSAKYVGQIDLNTH